MTNEKLLTALSFYANGENHNRRFPLFGGGVVYDSEEGLPSLVEDDRGEKARVAIAEYNKEQKESGS